MTKRLLALCVLAASTITSGCGSDGSAGTFLIVELRGSSMPKTVDIDLMFNGQSAPTTTLADPSGGVLTLPKRSVFKIRNGEGTISISAKAKDAGGVVFATATGTGVIKSNETTTVTLSFDSAGEGLAIDKATHDFGPVIINTAGAEVLFTITNTGTGPTAPLGVVLTGGASGFSISNNACNGMALAASATCQVGISFMPSAEGAVTGSIAVSNGTTASVSATLAGEGITPGALQISPTTQGFGSVTMGGNSGTQTFTVTNTGGQASGTITAGLMGTDAGQFVVTADGCNAQTLAANATCQITVRFSPSSAGGKSASLNVTATPGGSAIAQLAGMGLSVGNLIITPTSKDFGAVQQGMTGMSQVFTVQNSGGSDTGTLATAVNGANAAAFTVGTDTCMGQILAANASCMVTVTFEPNTAGSKIATLTVAGTPGGAAAAPLSGTALADAQLALNPMSNDFNSVVTGSGVNATFTLRNTGGVMSGVPTVSLSGPDMGQFSIMSNNCTAVLPAAGTCMIVVRFAPTSTGVKGATLSATATPGGIAMAALAGTGITPGALSISPTSQNFGSVLQGTTTATPQNFTVTNTGGSATGTLTATILPAGAEFRIVTNTCTATLPAAGTCMVSVRFEPTSAGAKTATLQVSGTPGGTAPASLDGVGLAPASLSMSPTTFTFPSTVVAGTSTTQNFTVTNSGGVAAGSTTALATTISGTGMAEFDITANTCTGTLGAGATCTVTIAFNPGSAGAKTASLNVTATPGGLAAASLNGTGQTPAALTLTAPPPNSVAFGAVPIGSSSTMTYRVSNTGQQTSSAITLTLTGTDFTLLTGVAGDCASGTTTLTGGATCNARVRFAPTMNVARTGTLGVSATTGGAPPQLSLTGMGQNGAAISGSVATNAFGNVEVGVASTPFVWTISNVGDVATTGTLTLSNTNTTEFTTTTTCGATLGATPATCTVTITFRPSTAGSRSGTITMAAVGGNGGSAAINVSGTGMYRLTVNRTFTGSGSPTCSTTNCSVTTTGSPPTINCGATCTALFPSGAVTLQARTQNGSNFHFSGWTGSTCSGPGRDCTFTLNASTTISANFNQMDNNIIFITSGAQLTNLGSATAYDTACNTVATTAGLNNAGGNAFVAVTSDAASRADARLVLPGTSTPARGWVRMDGLGFADTRTTLFTNLAVLNPVAFTENGTPSSGLAMTGANNDGSATSNCTNWTTTSGSLIGG
ncbi:MAG: choice-of-anchor D domain-containing protein, partial [Deltaproteobacteria bacterium]|nr:choice-of-anchor D domain-containing protein [Deltaproteobacteria bacterium]